MGKTVDQLSDLDIFAAQIAAMELEHNLAGRCLYAVNWAGRALARTWGALDVPE